MECRGLPTLQVRGSESSALISNAHDHPVSEHPGGAKTYHRLQKKNWPKMKADVAHYISRYVTCIEQKAVQLRAEGLMGTTSIPIDQYRFDRTTSPFYAWK